MSPRPLLLVSKSVRALLPNWREPLGQLFIPRTLSGLDITEGCCIRWGAVISRLSHLAGSWRGDMGQVFGIHAA